MVQGSTTNAYGWHILFCQVITVPSSVFQYFIGYKLNVTGTTEQTHYQLLFFSWLGFFSQVPEFLINVVSVVVAFHGAAVRQVYACLAVVVLVIAANESFVFIDTSSCKFFVTIRCRVGRVMFFWERVQSKLRVS